MGGIEISHTPDFLSATGFDRKDAPAVKGDPADEKTKKAVQDFEAFFISQMFQHMYETVPVNETFGGGNAEKIYRSMLIDEYGKMMAQSGGVGITNQIMEQMLHIQENAAENSGVSDSNGGLP